jgi:RHS repeat-associated protein
MKSLLSTLALAGFLFSGFPKLVFAQGDNPGDNAGGAVSQESQTQAPAGQTDFQTDLFTGRFGYSVPLELAPARHGSTPSIELQYNSANPNGWCGAGWDIDLGYIERETRFGVPVQWANGYPVKAYDDSKGFRFSLKKKSSDLVNVTDRAYRAQIQSDFTQFHLDTNNNIWTATDTSGNQYFFGSTTNSRMLNSKSGWSSNAVSGTFRWSLDKIQTPEGDIANITYTVNSNCLYPQTYTYNGHTNSLTNSCSVQFWLSSTNRTDSTISLKSGYRVDQTRLLVAISHKVDGSMIWSNRLSYTTSVSTERSLLSSVTRYGTNLTSTLPPLTFNYSQMSYGFQSAVQWGGLAEPGGDPSYYALSSTIVDLADLDGDGLPDRVLHAFPNGSGSYTNILVQHNTGSGFATAGSWRIGSQTYSGNSTSNFEDWSYIQSTHGRMIDMDGDGKADWVVDPYPAYFGSGVTTNYNHLEVQFNNSSNFSSSSLSSWSNVVDQQYANDGYGQTANFRAVENSGSSGTYVLMLDMNGDGLPDRVMLKRGPPYTNYIVQFNTGTGFAGTNTFGPYAAQGYTSEGGVSGDNGWAGLAGQISGQTTMRMLDINGDGLPDRVMVVVSSISDAAAAPQYQTNLIVELNNGYGFEPAIVWPGVDPYYNHICGGAYTTGINELGDDYQVAYKDVNGDGLPDRIVACQCATTGYTNFMVQINTGSGFAPLINWGPTSSQGYTTDSNPCGIQTSCSTLLDINGDGLPDRVQSIYPTPNNNYLIVELSKGPFPDLLTNVANGIGEVVSATYVPSTQYDNRLSTNSAVPTQYLMPFPLYTVSSVSVGDGLSSTNTTTYNYNGGYWNPTLRQFNGFAQAIAVDPLGMTNSHWFHQGGGRDNSAFGEYQDSTSALGKEGMPFRVDTIGSDGNLYKQVFNKVGETVLAGGQHFAFNSQTITVDYATNWSSYRATAQQFSYDTNNGNLTNTIDWGEVYPIVVNGQTFTDVTGDTVYKLTSFATLANTNITDKPATNILSTNSNGSTPLRQEIYSYDNATGNLLQELDLICSGEYRTNGYKYDSYGNEAYHTNAAGIVTQTTYDSSYKTFVAQSTTGGTFTTTTSYDPRSGKLSQSTDLAGLVTANYYDPFLRITETDVSTAPNGSTTEWLTRYSYVLGLGNGLSSNEVFIHKNDGVDTVNGHEILTYSDGLGRVVQTRQESETSGFRVTQTVYDKRGNVVFVTDPYFNSGTNYAKPSSTLGLLHLYDPAGRLTNVTAAVTGTFNGSGQLTGTSATGGDSGSPIAAASIAYCNGTDPWTFVTTDETGKIHRYSLDAYGRTNQVAEIVSGSTYTTTYGWNLAGDLTNVTDNAASQIQYGYNNVGEVVAMADPDMGVWQYQRDIAGRLRNQIDGNSNSVKFDYTDPLGRLVTRKVYDFTGTQYLGSTNVYDSNGGDGSYTVYAGQLFETIDNEGYVKNSYDVRGRTLKTVRYLSKNTSSYTTQRLYDDMDRVTQTVYPNGGPTVTNLYDSGANLSKVQQVGGSGTTYYTATGFNALDQLTGISYGNGVSTANTYYANSHRLESLVTTKSTNLQSLTYTYDQVSDLLSLSDGVYSGAASASLSGLAYDDLHRLTSLTRPGSGAVNYAYNSIGNVVSNGENGTVAYGYGSRLPHAVKSANGTNYAYDQNGNMLMRGNQQLVYDPDNRLSLVVMTNSTVAFGYDANGARLWKQGAVTNSLQVWIDGIYEEKDGKILYHILAGDRLVCTFDSGGITTEYYHPDHLHSTSVETDASGNPYQHFEYSAFGQSRYTSSSTAFPVSRRYTAQVLDEETGLYFYGSRYYDPQLGRFIQADTIIAHEFDPQSYDRYAYALNNPLKIIDPNGHAGKEVADWWSAKINSAFLYSTAGSQNVAWLGVMGSLNTFVGGLSEPLRFGSSAGAVSGDPHATLGDVVLAGVQEGSRAVAIVPVGAALGKATGTLVESLAASAEGEATGELAGSLGGCFVAGTLVQTENGPAEIQNVRIADRVWSYSLTADKWELRPVEATPIRDYSGDLITIRVSDIIIEATGNHPFWVVSGSDLAYRPTAKDVPTQDHVTDLIGRWVEARSLKIGDVLFQLTGQKATVIAVSTGQAHIPVYNLRVELNHTYAVSQAGILVHNKGAQVKPVSKYSDIPDPKNVGSGKNFTRTTKQKILEKNKQQNEGVLKSDQSGEQAVPSQQSQSGVTPPSNEAQVDHIVPKSKGGSNSPKNAQVLTREENQIKSDK